jgi:hypothetical protein
MAVPQPVAGLTHDLVLASGAPGNETLQGLMVAGGMKHYSCQPYTPFAPTAREGEATNRDLALPAVWELQQDFSGGVGKFIERKTEDNGYALSHANNCLFIEPTVYPNIKTGTTLYTGLAGCIMPPAALSNAGTINNAKQFIQFKTDYYFVTSDLTRKLYKYDPDGDSPTEVTLPTSPGSPADQVGAATQIYTDGASLYIAQGASKTVIQSTDGTIWNPYQVGSPAANVSADFLCFRDDGALAYIAGATLTPGTGAAGTATCTATTIGASGTIATGMVFYKGALWIGKPEGLFSWYQGKVDKRFDAMEHQSDSNFAKMAVHHELLYFNVKNQLFYTDGDRYVQVFPNDAGGFANISCFFPTSGPLLIGGRLLTFASGQTAAYLTQKGEDDASIGTVPWMNPTNVTADDRAYTTAELAATTDVSHYLKCTDFRIALPTNAVPVGIKVEIDTEFGYIGTFTARLVIGGSIVGDTRTAPWSPSGKLRMKPRDGLPWGQTLGGKADRWESTVTRADVVASTFGVAISTTGVVGTVRIESVKLTVFYTMLDTSLEQLYMFWGPDAPGLNPLWSDNDGTHPISAIGATGLYDSTGERIYFCCDDDYYSNKIHYLAMSPRYWPASFRTDLDTMYTSSIELTEFSAGFRTVPKWWYELELNVRDPLATTFATVEYCVDNGAWRFVEDEQGYSATFTLDDRVVGGYFPLELTGVYISLRIHMWTTDSTSVAKITHVTLRGLTVPKVRYQFAFPANCDHTVPTLTPMADSGETVRDLIRTAAAQGYPCKLQDPWGKWHLVKFREPSPMDVITDAEKPQNNARQRMYAAVQCVLVEVDELDAYGDLKAWSLG